MSGPKSSSYEVVENRRRERAAQQQAFEEFARVKTKWDEAVRRMSDAASRDPELSLVVPDAPPIPAPIATATSAEVLQAKGEWARALTALEEHFAVYNIRLDGSRLMARLSAAIRFDALPGPPQGSSATRARTSAPAYRERPASTEARRQRIQKILDALTGDSGQLAALEPLVSSILSEANVERAGLLEAELSSRVHEHNRLERDRRRNSEDKQRCLARLFGLDTDDVRAVRAELEASLADDVRLSDDLRARVERSACRAESESDMTYTADVVARALGKLGYEVGETFQTAFVNGSPTYVRRAEWDEHELRVRATTAGDSLAFGLVRVAAVASSAECAVRDRELEEQWCADYERMVAEVGSEGIRVRTVRRMPPGAAPVPFEARQRKARSVAAPLAKELPK